MNITGEPVRTRIPIVFNDAEADVSALVAGAMRSARSAQNRAKKYVAAPVFVQPSR